MSVSPKLTPGRASARTSNAWGGKNARAGADPIHASPTATIDSTPPIVEHVQTSDRLRILAADGRLSDLIEGTPETSGIHVELNSLEYGLGWLMDVAIHPEYERNGWIYLHHGDLCSVCSEEVPMPYAKHLEEAALPQPEKIVAAAQKVVGVHV